MTALVVIVIVVVVAAAVIAFVMRQQKQDSATTSGMDRSDGSLKLPDRPMPLVTDFHVTGDTARTVFAVPLGDTEPGDHLVELLGAAAVEHIRTRVLDGLPLTGVARVAVCAMRGNEPEQITVVELPKIGELPPPAPILMRSHEGHDPIAAVQAVTADTTVAATPSTDGSLEPVAHFVELPSQIDAQLRAIGVDTQKMSLEDLVIGLLRNAGYHIEIGRAGLSLATTDTADIYSATRGGKSSLLVIVRHDEGSYPELDEHLITEFAATVAQLRPHQGILITDKFSPYSMYEREKRDKRLVFVTRERLQAFVDSFLVS